MSGQYEVLSPWATVDPIPLKGISPRLKDLAGKKIGLYQNGKLAAGPILSVIEQTLQARYSTTQFIKFRPLINPNSPDITEPERTDRFADWLDEVDAVILAVGD